MKFLKLVLIGIVVVFLAFLGMNLVRVAFSLLSSLVWLAAIGLAAVALWKIFGPKGAKQMEKAEPENKLQNTELTLEEYKRKLEEQLKQSAEKRP
ncbi:MAG: hypothetical protein J2P21_26605 [Chloracidobacterium sp.]|nr:hypothetical protein [Chloracidobacterium sp.]